MRRKFIAKPKNTFEEYSSKVFHIDDEFKGYISLSSIKKVKEKLIVKVKDSELCLYDDGYKSIVFLPDDENWCVEAIYDNNSNIVEWYFDVTKNNSIDENGNPFFDDLFIDITVLPNGEVILLDEDDLLDALNKQVITTDDYNLAYKTVEIIKKNYTSNDKFKIDFFNKYFKMFKDL